MGKKTRTKAKGKRNDRYQPHDFTSSESDSGAISVSEDDEAFTDFLAQKQRVLLLRHQSTDVDSDASIFQAHRDGRLASYDLCLGALWDFGNDFHHKSPKRLPDITPLPLEDAILMNRSMSSAFVSSRTPGPGQGSWDKVTSDKNSQKEEEPDGDVDEEARKLYDPPVVLSETPKTKTKIVVSEIAS